MFVCVCIAPFMLEVKPDAALPLVAALSEPRGECDWPARRSQLARAPRSVWAGPIPVAPLLGGYEAGEYRDDRGRGDERGAVCVAAAAAASAAIVTTCARG